MATAAATHRDQAERGREQVERRRVRARPLEPVALLHHRDHEREQRRTGHRTAGDVADGGRHAGVVGDHPGDHPPDRERGVGGAQQPAVADAEHPVARRDPEEEQAAGGPLEQDGREIELHGGGGRSADDGEVARVPR